MHIFLSVCPEKPAMYFQPLMINKGYTLFYYTDMGLNAVYSCNIILHYEIGEAEKKKQ